jgi:hypothetical protein
MAIAKGTCKVWGNEFSIIEEPYSIVKTTKKPAQKSINF